MNYQSLTWQQVALCACLIGGTIGAYRFLGEGAAATGVFITAIVNLMMGRSAQEPKE